MNWEEKKFDNPPEKPLIDVKFVLSILLRIDFDDKIKKFPLVGHLLKDPLDIAEAGIEIHFMRGDLIIKAALNVKIFEGEFQCMFLFSP